jgi:hypothetical protein
LPRSSAAAGLILVARVLAIQHAQERRPGELARPVGVRVPLHLARDELLHLLGGHGELAAAGEGCHLHFAGALEGEHAREGFRDGWPARERAVIAEARNERAIIAVCVSGSRPSFCAETAAPSRECRWITHATSGRAICTALWMVKPARLMPYSPALTTLPSKSTFTSEEAVISWNIMP